MKVTSMRGKALDISKYLAENQYMPALGNAGLNARGDIISRDGSVIKSAEDVSTEYNKRNPNAVKSRSLTEIHEELIMTPEEAVSAIENNARAATEAAAKRTGRKIVDKD